MGGLTGVLGALSITPMGYFLSPFGLGVVQTSVCEALFILSDDAEWGTPPGVDKSVDAAR